MRTAAILTVMRDHTAIGTGREGGRACLCGELSWSVTEHAVHVAERIAAAVRAWADGAEAAELVQAAELGGEHLGRRVRVPVQGFGDAAGTLHGFVEDDVVPGMVRLWLSGAPGIRAGASTVVPGKAWVQVAR